MKEIMKEYETEWANIDEKQNVNEDPYMEWISLDKFAEAHQELRLAVDELMRYDGTCFLKFFYVLSAAVCPLLRP